MSSTESFVDGVIEVIRERHELFNKRKMVFKKMNGIRAPYTTPFTLCDGRFRIFSKLKNKKITHPNNFISIPDSDEKYSTGNSYFDDKLEGGFKKGSVIGLEIDESVDRFVFVPLFAPLILNFLSHNNSSIIVSPTDQDSNSLMKYLTPYLEEKQFLENLKIIGHSFSSKSDLLFEQNDSNFDHIKKEIIESYSHSKQKNRPTVLEMDCSLLN